jgi:hypothetical protein
VPREKVGSMERECMERAGWIEHSPHCVSVEENHWPMTPTSGKPLEENHWLRVWRAQDGAGLFVRLEQTPFDGG